MSTVFVILLGILLLGFFIKIQNSLSAIRISLLQLHITLEKLAGHEKSGRSAKAEAPQAAASEDIRIKSAGSEASKTAAAPSEAAKTSPTKLPDAPPFAEVASFTPGRLPANPFLASGAGLRQEPRPAQKPAAPKATESQPRAQAAASAKGATLASAKLPAAASAAKTPAPPRSAPSWSFKIAKLRGADTTQPRLTVEQLLGGNLAIWVGGIALALSALFFVKYSIEAGWLTPALRDALGGVFGLSLIAAAQVLRSRGKVQHIGRISQALTGAGIISLYAASFAATSLHGLLPPFVGTVLMTLITIAAVALSLREGPAIAVMGLAGGYLTPILIGSENPSEPFLFLYLYMVFLGLLLVSNKSNWPWLSVASLLAALGWALFWVLAVPEPSTLIVSLYLFAIPATIAILYRNQADLPAEKLPETWLGLLALALVGALGIEYLALTQHSIQLLDWGFYAVLSLGTYAVALRWMRALGFAPLLAGLLVAFLAFQSLFLFSWTPLFLAFQGMIVLHLVGSSLMLWKGGAAKQWISFPLALTGFLLALLYYGTLMEPGLLQPPPDAMAMTLLLNALLLSVFAFATNHLAVRNQGGSQLFELPSAAAFLALGAAGLLLLPALHLSLYLAGAIALLLLAFYRYPAVGLRTVLGLAILAFITSYAQPFGIFLFDTLLELVRERDPTRYRYHALEALFYLVLPALLVYLTWYVMDRRGGVTTAKLSQLMRLALWCANFALYFGFFSWYLSLRTSGDLLFLSGTELGERGGLNLLMLVLAGLLLSAYRYWPEKALRGGAVAILGYVLVRALSYDFFLFNPFAGPYPVSGWVFLNPLLLSFLVPGLVAYGLALVLQQSSAKTSQAAQDHGLPFALKLFGVVGGFFWISANVRLFFQNDSIFLGKAPFAAQNYGEGELIAYSLVWALYGLLLLGLALLGRERFLRLASLAVMVLAVGKVFLIDTAALEGFYRVLSFFGLGVALLGLGYLYSRLEIKPLAQKEAKSA